MLVHLAGELAGELDRPHLGAEDAAERALDEAGELLLEVAQDAHQGWCFPGRARRNARTADR